MKVEVYLKARKLPYETSYGNPRGAPKQKVPWVADADGTIIADSSAILAHFEKKSKTPFDEGMDENARARAHAIKRLIEESLYFVALYARWQTDAGWEAMKPVFEQVPAAIRWIIMPIVRKSMRQIGFAQGTGRHTPEEIWELGVRISRRSRRSSERIRSSAATSCALSTSPPMECSRI